MLSKNSRTNSNEFPFKLAAIDIDDTLVGPDKLIGLLNRQAVKRLRDLGCRVILASGRRHENMLPYHRELGLDGFVVSTQGAIVRDSSSSRVLHEAMVSAPDAAELVAEGLRRDVTIMHWSRRGVVANKHSRWVELYVEDCRDPVPIVAMNGRSGVDSAQKIIWAADPRIIAQLAATARERYRGRFEVTVTDNWYLEFTSPNAHKAVGVSAVASHYGIEPSETLTFGDGNNDVSMLGWAGMSVAMAHGRPAAKAAAKLTAPAGNPESSLARAVAAVMAEVGLKDEPASVGAAA